VKFEQLKDNALKEWENLHSSKIPCITVCRTLDSSSTSFDEILNKLRAAVKENNLNVNLVEAGSTGIGYMEPVMYIDNPGFPRIFYKRVTAENAVQILNDFINENNPGTDFAFCRAGEGNVEGVPLITDLPFMKNQVRIALRNCGFIDPGNIYHYIAVNGYSGLDRALQMTPVQVIEEIEKSGLRGRGGAGFPVANKWKLCSESTGEEKYIICNANEGDPDAVSVRVLLESDPHCVLEGMLIAAYAASAGKGYLYINREYKLAMETAEKAIIQMKECGLLGQKILESDFSFDIELRESGGAFICGEETALILSLEGNRGMPLSRPPYPAARGLNGKPTVVNNAETLANVSAIMAKGADWFSGYGKNSKGTKVFTLAGKVARKGLAELPLDITLRQIIFETGGGIPGGNEFKAVRIGGPGGGFLPETALDDPADFESLEKSGTIMGSGSVVVIDNEECIVDDLKNVMSFNSTESCGECIVCREGTAQISDFLTDITGGKAKSEDINLLLELGEVLQMMSLCGFGKNAANPVVTAINSFRDEFTAHISRKRCSALVCKALVSFHILPDRCQGCMECAKICSVQAINGSDKMIHVIDQKKCTKCGKCLEVCPSEYEAVMKASGRIPATPTEPIPVGSWESD